VAVSDATGTLARPLPAILRVESPAGQDALAAVIAQEEPAVILVGEPRHLSGERGEQARQASAFAGRLRKRFGLPVEFVDERLSTVEAARRAKEAGSRADLDSIAACVLLESYLQRGI
jgi:putative holliday junction resolvase